MQQLIEQNLFATALTLLSLIVLLCLAVMRGKGFFDAANRSQHRKSNIQFHTDEGLWAVAETTEPDQDAEFDLEPVQSERAEKPRSEPVTWDQNQSLDLSDVGVQLKAVMAASFEKRRVLNKSEYRAFRIIEKNIAELRRGYRVFAQTSLGQILCSKNSHAFRSINSKRVDILVVDAYGFPVLAVEYNGGGHYQGDAAARDAIKKEALRRAGINYIALSDSDSDESIRRRILDQFAPHVAA